MHELDAILDLWRTAPEDARGAVLATVVHVQGSAYRRPGARMLILPDGRRVGTVSGGCLEADVSKKAWWFTESGAPSVRVYDTSSGDDAVWEFGLGCNGTVHVLFERLDSPDAAATLDFLAQSRAAMRSAVIATVIARSSQCPLRIGDRALIGPQGTMGGALAGAAIERAILEHARDAFLHRTSRLAHLPDCDVFLEWVAPPVRLVIFGAGHDAIPLCAIAAQMGWRVTIADGRPNYARPSRFPEAAKVVVMHPSEPLASVEIDRDTVVVMMTHNYPMDAALLPRILPLHPRYLGLLGPVSRTMRLMEEAEVLANRVDVHAPVGLDLGGDSPESIAIAIAAEIQAVLNGRNGGMLKHRTSPIHAAVEVSGTRAEVEPAVSELAICER
jgi:xanthine dehydrogenase accessory factor